MSITFLAGITEIFPFTGRKADFLDKEHFKGTPKIFFLRLQSSHRFDFTFPFCGVGNKEKGKLNMHSADLWARDRRKIGL